MNDGEVRDAQLVLAFGSGSEFSEAEWFAALRGYYPDAQIVSCSTAGEISQTEVTDESIVATAVRFDSTRLAVSSATVAAPDQSKDAGAKLAKSLIAPDLRHVVVLSEGLLINGSELAAGLRESLPAGVVVTGGLAGDGERMKKTIVGLNAQFDERLVVAIGFYGDSLEVGYGSLGGWDPFGPERIVTKATNNVLYELDGCSALGLYKQYLGEYAAGLPASGLLFPLAVRTPGSTTSLVRTILAVDEASQSITFAGDVPLGAHARLMRANFDRLVEGAVDAARGSRQSMRGSQPELGLLISCVGRKLVLGQRVEEEVEGVREVLGSGAVLTGFYSYGEICPHTSSPKCELHNQTMTITTFRESVR